VVLLLLASLESHNCESLRALVPSSFGEPVMMPSSVMEDFSAHFEKCSKSGEHHEDGVRLLVLC
jgi:hypothetical protein